jgi:zinc protease
MAEARRAEARQRDDRRPGVAPQRPEGDGQIGLPGRTGHRRETASRDRATDRTRADGRDGDAQQQTAQGRTARHRRRHHDGQRLRFADVVRHPSFPASELEIARNNFLQEIDEQRASPEFLASEQLFKAVFGASDPYGFSLPAPEAVKALQREAIRHYAATWYAPNSATLIVVGDVQPDDAFNSVKKAFASWARVEQPKQEFPAPHKRDKRQIYFVDRPGSVQSVIAIGAIAPPRKDADYLALRTADTIFGGAFYSRLTRNIREAKGYTYSPFSSADTRRRAGIFWTQAAVRNEVTGPTILEMLYELDRMRVAPVTDEELQNAKTYSNGTLSLEMETQAGLANRLSTIYTYGLSRDFLPTFSTKLNALTVADIQHAAAKYFDTYRGAIVIVGDYGQVKEQVAPFGDVTLVKK